MNLQAAWQKQEEIIKRLKKEKPELIIPEKQRQEEDVFNEIGILNMPKNRPLAYLRLFFEDFIVEEITADNKIVRVNDIGNNNYKRSEKEKTLYAHLIKMGLTTNAAVEKMAQELEFPGAIGYAGLKDDKAITAQLIAMRKGRLSIEEIEKKEMQNIILTNFYFGKDNIRPGYLKGNLFTITVRTKDKINEEELAIKLENIGKYGILNYYQSQRFGGVRLTSHKIGKLIMQGNYELAVRYLLFKTNQYEMPLIKELKKQAEKVYPNWLEIIKLFEKLPYSFRYELKVANLLKNHPKNYIGALREIKDSITICLYAYSSLLFNKYLSEYSKSKGCIEEEFPLLISPDPSDSLIYKKYLAEDNTENFLKNLLPLKITYLARRKVKARIIPENISFKVFPAGAVISFSLPKGAYATTFLANIFELYEDEPVPEWVRDNEIDAKELLGQGSLKEIKEKFKDKWHVKIF